MNLLFKAVVFVATPIMLLIGAGCGGSGSSGGPISPTPTSSAAPSVTPKPTAIPPNFANTYSGKIALRDSSKNLSGELANITLSVGASGSITGTVTTNPEAIAETLSKAQKRPYTTKVRREVTATRDAATVKVTGSATSRTGTFTAAGSSGSGADAASVTLQGTLEQLSNTQVAQANIAVKYPTGTTTGSGVLKGATQTQLPDSDITPPLLTGDLKIPQGATVRFAPTGTEQPANPDATETGDVVNSSLPDYHSPGYDGYSNIDSGGWAFAYDGKYITLKVPDNAPITSGYKIRDRSTAKPVSANFTVAPPVVTLFFGGAADTTSQIVVRYAAQFKQAHPSTYSQYFTWTDEDDALAVIHNQSSKCRINLVGHSYGGDTAATVAKISGRKIDLLITVDPVSWFGPSYASVKASTKVWYNINATGGGSFGDLVAGFGSPWGSGPKDFSIYSEVPHQHGDFSQLLAANGVENVLVQASQ